MNRIKKLEIATEDFLIDEEVIKKAEKKSQTTKHSDNFKFPLGFVPKIKPKLGNCVPSPIKLKLDKFIETKIQEEEENK